MDENPKLPVTLITGRTIEQGVSKEQGKASDEYAGTVTTCHIDPQDLKKLKIKENTNIQVTTQHGTITLKATKSPTAPHPNLIFIPYGPWANAIVDPETDSTGMPSLKGIPATIEPAPNKPILQLDELLKQQFRKKAKCTQSKP
jgi:formylmethanofuran dehydrogenase subunit D